MAGNHVARCLIRFTPEDRRATEAKAYHHDLTAELRMGIVHKPNLALPGASDKERLGNEVPFKR